LHERIYLDVPPNCEGMQIIVEVARLSASGSQVGLGIEAPLAVVISRSEREPKEGINCHEGNQSQAGDADPEPR